jgi:hypothetical protein
MANYNTVRLAHKTTNLKRKQGNYKNRKCAVEGCIRNAKEEHHPNYNDSNYTIPACSAAHHHVLSKSF